MSQPNVRTRRMNRMEYLNKIATGLLILGALLILWLIRFNIDDRILTGVSAAGFALIALGVVDFIRYRMSPDTPKVDERTMKMATTSAMVSWILSFGFTGALYLLVSVSYLKISAQDALIMTNLFMLASMVLFNLLFVLRSARAAKET